ncbi:MAG: TauD/TfdA family dioxygenase [Myxococcales bacterium]|nr:TauD/TfdA family dioxygenase [Myxococcales bacterium]
MPYETIAVERIGGALGAIVSGVDLAKPLSDGVFQEIHHALVANEVLFFHDQELSGDQQLELASRFGELSLYPLEKFFGADQPGHQVIVDSADNAPGTDLWHTDVSWLEKPPKVALITVLETPPYGGDTMWASTSAAYEALSPTIQRMLDGVEAVHSCHGSFVEIAERKSGVEGLAERFRAAYPEVVHPLVRTHPVSGRRSLYMTDRGVMHRIAEMSDAESSATLDFLEAHVDQPRFHCRWHWELGQLAIWDERTTLHRGVSDHYPQRRVIRRCTVDGEAPFFDPQRKVAAEFVRA